MDKHVRWLAPPEEHESTASVVAWLRGREFSRGIYLDLAQRGWDGEELGWLLDHLGIMRLLGLAIDAGALGLDPEVGLRRARTVAAAPSLRGIHWLDIGSNAFGDAGVEALLVPNLGELGALDLRYNQISSLGVQSVAEAPGFGRLTVLDLSLNDVDDEGVVALAGSSNMARLAELHLDGNGIGLPGIVALAESRHLHALSVLTLSGGYWRGDRGEVALSALANSPGLPLLEDLTLSGAGVGDTGLASLAASPLATRLRSFNLNGNRITGAGLEAFGRGLLAGQLRALDLANNLLDDQGIGQLARLNLARIWCLDLGGNPFGETGIWNLAQSQTMGELRELKLYGIAVGDAGIGAIAASAAFPYLESLHIANTGVTEVGIAALAESVSSGSLRTLDLTGNEIGDAGLRHLARSPYLTHLAHLGLSSTGITDDGLRELARSTALPTYLTIHAGHNLAVRRDILAKESAERFVIK